MNTQLELAQKIVVYDINYNEYDNSIWDVYNKLSNPKIVAEMIRDYSGDRAYHQDIADDFQSYTPRTRSVAEDNVKKLNDILQLLNQFA